tara:strand:+ start:319 stop:849 length:531 start_codon:yes stop_codon:yes gene_type:complete
MLGQYTEIHISRLIEPKFLAAIKDLASNYTDNNSPARNTAACVWREGRCISALTAHINTHRYSSVIIFASFSRSISHFIPYSALNPIGDIGEAELRCFFLLPTPGIKSSQAARGRGIFLPTTTHAVSPIVSCRVNPTPHHKRAQCKSCREPKYHFEISWPTTTRLLTSSQRESSCH